MSPQIMRIGLIGVGTVGQSVAHLLKAQEAKFKQVTGVSPVLACALVRNPQSKDLSFLPSSCKVVENAEAFFKESFDVVLELIGGTDAAAEFVKTALGKSIPVVTANKALLAHQPDIFDFAKNNNTTIGFEASCGGGIPIIAGLRDGVAANDIEKMLGILNGTCNYILTQIAEKGMDYDKALSLAQELGYAEADPTFDVGGFDAAHKIAILASIAFGVEVDADALHVEGIDTINAQDIAYAKDLGYSVKLLAVGERVEKGVSIRVHPVVLDKDHPLASVNGVNNAITVKGNFLGRAMFYGPGAGGDATASAVVADLLEIGCGQDKANFEKILRLRQSIKPTELVSIQSIESRYYVRMDVKDVAGVMRKITGIFEEHGISLASVLQQESYDEQVPIVLLTHKTSEGEIHQALEEIASSDVLCGQPVVLHLEGKS